MVYDSEEEVLASLDLAEIREQWNPKNWEDEPDENLRKILLEIAEHYYNLPEEEFKKYAVRAYCSG